MSKSASTPEEAHESTETVWTATATDRSETAGEDKIYHTDQTCRNLQHAQSTVDHPRDALNNGWRICEACAGTASKSGRAVRMVCPNCGEETGNLPNHIRRCDG